MFLKLLLLAHLNGTIVCVTFDVNSVEVGNVTFAHIPINKAAELVEETYFHMHRGSQRLNYETGMANRLNMVDLSRSVMMNSSGFTYLMEQGKPVDHAFLAAVLAAYSNHLPLTLSPDDWWLMILLSLSDHIQYKQSSTSRGYKSINKLFNSTAVVNITANAHQYGIVFGARDRNRNLWPHAIRDVCDQISENTNKNVVELLVGKFSTTNVVEQTVFRLMSVKNLESHTRHRIQIRCGIPEITLLGTDQDYENIINRINKLSELFPDFAWYLDRVKDHTQTMKQTMVGHLNQTTDWWKGMVKIYRPRADLCGGGQEILTGWIADWFAYSNKRGTLNPLHGRRRPTTTTKVDTKDKLTNVRGKNFRLQITKLLGGARRKTARPLITTVAPPKQAAVHVYIEDLNRLAIKLIPVTVVDTVRGEERTVLFTAGFLGVAQGSHTNSVQPAIGWITFYQY